MNRPRIDFIDELAKYAGGESENLAGMVEAFMSGNDFSWTPDDTKFIKLIEDSISILRRKMIQRAVGNYLRQIYQYPTITSPDDAGISANNLGDLFFEITKRDMDLEFAERSVVPIVEHLFDAANAVTKYALGTFIDEYDEKYYEMNSDKYAEDLIADYPYLRDVEDED